MHAEGLGVAADAVEAYMWFELAANTGHETAIRNRAYLAEGMSAAKIAQAEARARSWRAVH
jgi:TPR repeat protein